MFSILEYKSTFNFFDKDRDGRISKDELVKALRATGQNPTDQEIQELLKSADIDGNYNIQIINPYMPNEIFHRYQSNESI